MKIRTARSAAETSGVNFDRSLIAISQRFNP
jgi:hypothetical protein